MAEIGRTVASPALLSGSDAVVRVRAVTERGAYCRGDGVGRHYEDESPVMGS